MKDKYERVRKRVGPAYSLVEHAMYCSCVGEGVMLKYIIEKKKLDPQVCACVRMIPVQFLCIYILFELDQLYESYLPLDFLRNQMPPL